MDRDGFDDVPGMPSSFGIMGDEYFPEDGMEDELGLDHGLGLYYDGAPGSPISSLVGSSRAAANPVPSMESRAPAVADTVGRDAVLPQYDDSGPFEGIHAGESVGTSFPRSSLMFGGANADRGGGDDRDYEEGEDDEDEEEEYGRSRGRRRGRGSAAGDAKRQERLARNRESARQSRQRKKKYLEHLEDKVATLTARVDTERQHLLQTAFEALGAQREALLRSARDSLRAGKADAADAALRSLSGPLALASAEKRSIVRYHIEALTRALAPPHLRLLLWLMTRDEAFFHAAGDPSASGTAALWPLLCNELGLTADQSARLQSRILEAGETGPLHAQVQGLSAAVRALRELETSVLEAANEADQLSNQALAILSPEQAVNFLGWLEDNRSRIAALASDRRGAAASQ